MTPAGLVDDPTVPDAAILWRRIPPWHFIYDGNLQRWRPSSAAFDDDPDGSPMSILFAEVVATTSRTAEETLSDHGGYALAAFTAVLARACRQGIARDPIPEEPAHALVFGPKPKSVQRRLAKESTWVIPPPQRPSA